MNLKEYGCLLKPTQTGKIITNACGESRLVFGSFDVVWDKHTCEQLEYFRAKKIKTIRCTNSEQITKIYRNLAELAQPYLKGKHNGCFVRFDFSYTNHIDHVDMTIINGQIVPMHFADAILCRFSFVVHFFGKKEFLKNTCFDFSFNNADLDSDESSGEEEDEQ